MVNDICINKTVTDLTSGALYLILWLSPQNEYGYWHNLNSRSRKPCMFLVKDVVDGEYNGRYEVECYSPQISLSDNLTDKEIFHMERIWDLMQTAVETEPDIYDSKLRFGILQSIADERGIRPNNLYTLLDRYWRCGKTKSAFLPKYSNCGASGNIKNYHKKTGRPEIIAESAGKILSDSDFNNFMSAIKRYYLTREKMSFKSAYEKLLQDFYTLKSTNNNGEEILKLLPQNETPSFRQFQYWYYKNRDIIGETKKRDGERKFNLDKRSILGKADYGLMGPGAQYQIDATVGDIYLVSRFDRSNLIGRPVIYFVIDAFSRMVTGMSVGLEGPSWAGAMGALANMATDKIKYCRKYGVEIQNGDWDCCYVPASIIGDRGEMESKNADNLANVLGIRVVNAPSYRADLKGIIEQHFHTINTNSVALLPGSVKPDMSKRGGHDYRLDAVLDIEQFTQIIIKCVLYYNNHHYMDYFEKNEAMMKDNVEAIPCKIWEWGIKNCSGLLRSFPEDTVKLAVMPTDKATVTAKGIRFKGMYYSSEKSVKEFWLEKARSGRTWQVTASYDPHDMTDIYIWDKDDKTYDICSLLEWNHKYSGKYLDEIIYEQRKENIIQKQLKTKETEAKINLNSEIETIVSEAKDMAYGLPTKSNKARLSHIRDNRRAERDNILFESRGSTSEIGKDSLNIPISIQPQNSEEELSPTLKMIKRKVEERLKK